MGPAAAHLAPEKLGSWEVGFKSQWFHRHLAVNVTAYDAKFTGYQTASTGTDGSGSPVLRSAGELFTKGAEGAVIIRPFNGEGSVVTFCSEIIGLAICSSLRRNT